jgi:hypothetical protein
MTVYGQLIQDARRINVENLGAFTANTTVTTPPIFMAPPGCGSIRVIGIHVAASAVPVDNDGTLVLNVYARDVSEGAADTLVSAQDLETLIVAANKAYELTQASDSTEKIFTLEEGDTIYCTLVSNSAGIDTNTNLTLAIEYYPVPDYTSFERVKHPSEYVV